MSDFDNVIERATGAVARGIADVTVTELPDTSMARDFDSKLADPLVVSEHTHRVRLVIE